MLILELVCRGGRTCKSEHREGGRGWSDYRIRTNKKPFPGSCFEPRIAEGPEGFNGMKRASMTSWCQRLINCYPMIIVTRITWPLITLFSLFLWTNLLTICHFYFFPYRT